MNKPIYTCQRDITLLHKVASSWGLSMNINKCVVLQFQRWHMDLSNLLTPDMYYLNGIPIPVKDSAMDIDIDSTFKFHQHIHNAVQKAGGMAQNLLKSTVNHDV